jgi:ferredoxin
VTGHVKVDGSLCIGSGNCVELAPAHFTQDEDTGLVVLLRSDVEASDEADVERAAVICPAGVIRVEPSA